MVAVLRLIAVLRLTELPSVDWASQVAACCSTRGRHDRTRTASKGVKLLRMAKYGAIPTQQNASLGATSDLGIGGSSVGSRRRMIICIDVPLMRRFLHPTISRQYLVNTFCGFPGWGTTYWFSQKIVSKRTGGANSCTPCHAYTRAADPMLQEPTIIVINSKDGTL